MISSIDPVKRCFPLKTARMIAWEDFTPGSIARFTTRRSKSLEEPRLSESVKMIVVICRGSIVD